MQEFGVVVHGSTQEYNICIITFNHLEARKTINTYYIYNNIELLKILEEYNTEAYITHILCYSSKTTLQKFNYVITRENKQLLIDKINLSDLLDTYLK